MKLWMEQMENRLDRWGKKLEGIQIRYPADLVTGVLCLVLSLVILLIIPRQVMISEKDLVNGRAFPTMLMYLMAVCSALLIGKELYKIATHQPLEMKTLNLLVEVKALIIMGILLVTYLLARLTDLFVVGAVFCCLAFLVFFRCKKKSYYAITLTLAVVIWVCFRFVLGVTF